MKELIFDLEANGLYWEAGRIWCICAKELGSDVIEKFYPDEIEQGLELLKSADYLIGHNIIGYDLPLIYKLYGLDLRHYPKMDTYITSQLLNPDRGGHSVEDWAERLKLPFKKVHQEDWLRFDPNIVYRCIVDVAIQEKIYEALLEEMNSD
jgi:DNA polymerase III epsilon subunit-like protein